MLKNLLIILLLLLFQGAAQATGAPADSIGVEKRNGKLMVVHKVVAKETLFAISRRYGVPVAQIVDANSKIQSGLSIGQLVYVPRKTATATVVETKAPAATTPVATTTPPVTAPVPAARTFVVDAQGNKIHQVVEKQTLFSIARLYQVSVADIKKWNKLTTDGVTIGSKIIVGVDNKVTTAPQYVPEADDDVEKVKAVPVKTAVKKTLETPVVAARNEPKAPEPALEKMETPEDTESENISKITESGLAEVIDNRTDNNKYLALHKTAPMGTILQVKNTMNNQSVYVRVIGKLPATGGNDKVIIKISKRAHQKLAALDNRFLVEVSYMP